MSQPEIQTTEAELLCTADADFELEPMVRLWVYHENGGFWLSWDETCKLAELLRRRVTDPLADA